MPKLEVLRSLDSIADEIRAAWADTRSAQVNTWAGYFQTGHLLSEARDRFGVDDRAYGAWFDGENFEFTSEWGRRLRLTAEHETEAREHLATAVATSKPQPGLNAVYAQVVP